MKPKHKRLWFIIVMLSMMAGSLMLMLSAFKEQLLFFYTPSELAAVTLPSPSKSFRLGGLVQSGTVQSSGAEIWFDVTDQSRSVTVHYTGILPDLFREGQGVVVLGKLATNGVVEAEEILAKHDERYMPKEVEEKLKQQGHWQPEQQNGNATQ